MSNLENFIDAKMASFFITMPGKILSIDSKNFCEVQPMYIQRFLDEDSEWNYEELPPITNVPLLVLGTSEVFVNLPSKKDDKVTLVFTNKDFYDYYQSDGNDPFIATFNADNNINNCYAIPMSLNKEDAPTLQRDCFSVEMRDGSTKLLVGKNGEIQTKASAMRVGAVDASQAAAKAQETKNALDAIINHINTSIIPPLAGLGIVIPPLVTSTNVASTKLFTNG